jgi:hypothetical protein
MNHSELNTSHELAAALHRLAEKLESHPPFCVETGGFNGLALHYHDGSSFQAAMKILGGNAVTDDYFCRFESQLGILKITLATYFGNVGKKTKKTVEVETWELEDMEPGYTGDEFTEQAEEDRAEQEACDRAAGRA